MAYLATLLRMQAEAKVKTEVGAGGGGASSGGGTLEPGACSAPRWQMSDRGRAAKLD